MGDDACTGRRRTNGCRSALPTGSKGLYLLPDGYMAGGRARHIGPAGCKHFFFFFFFEGYSTLFLIHYKTILFFFNFFLLVSGEATPLVMARVAAANFVTRNFSPIIQERKIGNDVREPFSPDVGCGRMTFATSFISRS